ncbi:adenosylcobinamide-GDP ribazoletransferase [Nocardia speluncae]|uniref:Adenosylcobinamide-GDP ribazoletransferase n=1 Tax=Nocardia speluncae TaxID=419477 RepID=A0A846XT04_9NOCA|nr:adenosylcobinamide-GDP ribazoletransferase [Nocardia speluncae]NKY36684.1 adenosylcobinamide-GDP ribazoletransferase [Nocardia speluncae]
MLTLRLTFSWLTVLPVRGPDEVDRRAAARAIALAPVAGVVLGLAAAAVLWLLEPAGTAAGFAAVAVLALLTRGMHLDGLADTFDGLGVYGPPERAREVMKSGGAGPFGVAAIVLTAGIQAGAFTILAGAGNWYAAVLAVTLGRVAVVAACRRGIEPAPDTRFGALVAGTQSPVTVTAWTVVAAAAAVFAVPGLAWSGPLVAVLALMASVRLVDHGIRRLGGLSGDLLGTAVELATTLAALGFAAANAA